MSGPKYYTVKVTDGDAMEVYRRMSKFQRGVRVTVNGNKLEFVVSNNAWLNGVDYEFVQNQVRAAQNELANERRIQELIRKGKQDEIKWAEGRKARIIEKFNDSCEDVSAEIDRVMKQVEGLESVTTPLRRISIDAEKKDMLSKLETLRKDYQDIMGRRDELLRQLDQHIEVAKTITTVDQCNRIKKKRPDVNFDSKFNESVILDIERNARRLNERVRDAARKLAILDAELNKEPLCNYRDRIAEKVSSIDVMEDGAFDSVDELLKEIWKEHQARMDDLRRKDDSSRVRSETETMNRALDSLRGVLVTKQEDYGVTEHHDTDASEVNGKKMEECRQLIETIESRPFIDRDLSDRLEDCKYELSICARRIKIPTATQQLTDLESDLRQLATDAEECSRKHEEYQIAKDRYAEAFGRFVTVFGSDNKAFDDMQRYEEMADSVFSMRNADSVIEDLKAYAEEISKVCDKALREQTYNMLCTTFNKSEDSKHFDSVQDRTGRHTYFAKKGREYRGVIFDVCSSDDVSVSPRMVVLSNGRTLITPDGLQELYGSCGWSREMEDQCADFLVGVEHEEAPEEVRLAMSRPENMVTLSVEKSIEYLIFMEYTEGEMRELGYTRTGVISGGNNTRVVTNETNAEMRTNAGR